MNKRIRELAEQAMESTGVEGLGGEYRELNPEKFAELIVRECVTICNSVQEQYGQYTFTATTVKNRIQEHFGVAE